MKYMDGVIKDEYGKPKRVGYPKQFQELIAAEGGDNIKYVMIQPEIDLKFENYIKKAKKDLEAKSYKEALKHYKSALELKPNSKVVEEKIEKIQTIIKSIEEFHEANF
jgi:tetratricopeptide (TPR) repeat protein